LPTFCRHNHLVQNCSICSREQAVEMRPVVSSSAPKVSAAAAPKSAAAGRGAGGRSSATGASARLGATGVRNGRGVVVKRLARGAEDGYHSQLVPGLKSSSDAGRLAVELVYAAERLSALEREPCGLWAEVAGDGPIEERLWLAFLIALIGLGSGEDVLTDVFSAVEAVRVPWGSAPELDAVVAGPRGGFDPARWPQTVAAYCGWAQRAGSQQAAFIGEPAWTPGRRFDRLSERLGTLPGMSRDARFELLTALGALGVCEVEVGRLHLAGENEATVAAKRVFGIGDPLLLDRRASALADASGLPLAAFDLGLHNWGTGMRIGGGVPIDLELDPGLLAQVQGALKV
jgi:hypothetical protein